MVDAVDEVLGEESLALPDGLKNRPPTLELEFSVRERMEVDRGTQPHHLFLNIKCKPGQLKVLRDYQRAECWAVGLEGRVEPLELLSCSLVRHDVGRGCWTYYARVSRLPGPNAVARLRLSELAPEEVIS